MVVWRNREKNYNGFLLKINGVLLSLTVLKSS